MLLFFVCSIFSFDREDSTRTKNFVGATVRIRLRPIQKHAPNFKLFELRLGSIKVSDKLIYTADHTTIKKASHWLRQHNPELSSQVHDVSSEW